MVNGEIAGTLVAPTGQSGHVVYCYSEASGAETDRPFTISGTTTPLTSKDGYIIRIVGMQIFGSSTKHSLTINSKPNDAAGVKMLPTIIVTADNIAPVTFGAIGVSATQEYCTITMTTTGAVSCALQVIYESVSATTTTIDVTPPTPAPTATADFDPTVFVYRDNVGTPAGEGENVHSWLAKIGAYEAHQPITARRPTWRESVFNGKPALEFYLDDILPITVGSLQTLVNGTNAEITIFLVVKFYNTTATQILLAFANGAAANPLYRIGQFTGTDWVVWKTDDAGTADNLASATADNSAHLLTIVVDNSGTGTCKLFVRSNGDTAAETDTPTATNTTFNGGALTATNATFGAVNTNSTNALFSDAFLGRCIIYNTELSNAQRASIENELIGIYL